MQFDTLRRDGNAVMIIDQTALPLQRRIVALRSLDDAAHAIRSMLVRGAPLIGATAAYGVALAMREDASDTHLAHALKTLAATRPTAVNLHWALDRMKHVLADHPDNVRRLLAWSEADAIRKEDIEANRLIGEHGLTALRRHRKEGRPLELLTHCNAGALATCGWGTALAPIYLAHQQGIEVHVWVSETRPRNQGLLTAWELEQVGVPYTLISDNAAGLLMARGHVDAVIVGADRIAANGDTANKIGTSLKALAAKAAQLPFYVAAPWSTIDLGCPNGAAIPIEERDPAEQLSMTGLLHGEELVSVDLTDRNTPVWNPAFDVTPATLIAGIITERGLLPVGGLRNSAPAR